MNRLFHGLAGFPGYPVYPGYLGFPGAGTFVAQASTAMTPMSAPTGSVPVTPPTTMPPLPRFTVEEPGIRTSIPGVPALAAPPQTPQQMAAQALFSDWRTQIQILQGKATSSEKIQSQAMEKERMIFDYLRRSGYPRARVNIRGGIPELLY